MRFPLKLNMDLTKYIVGNKLRKVDKFPLVLMLEPTHLCNLACSGCGRIREYAETLSDEMSLEECLQSVDECPAPVVTITGGEPFLYTHIHELIEGVLDRGKHIYLCTNGQLLEDALDKMRPHPNFTINVHMDGLEATHDRILEQKGAYTTAISAIRKAKHLGFRLCTNTTIFKETDLGEIDDLFTILTSIGVDGFLVAPGFGYEAVGEKLFLERRDIEHKFREVFADEQASPVPFDPNVSPLSDGRETSGMYPVGKPDPQHPGLESSLLSHHRYPLPYLPGNDGKDRLGKIRRRQRRALCPMHDALRIRALRCPGNGKELARYVGNDRLESILNKTFSHCIKSGLDVSLGRFFVY